MTTQKSVDARARGLRLAAKIAGVSGLAMAVFGAVEARAAETTAEARAKLPFEHMAQVRGGDCGCTACWGPPAPPQALGRGAAAS
jgi:hypothetical protein